MPLFLREEDILRVVTMDDLIAVVDDAFRQHGRRKAINRPRQRSTSGTSVLHVMSAALPALGVMGLKAYSSAGGKTRFVGTLYSTETGELLAMMEADRLGQMRTGAASAVATKYLARANAGSIGIIGAGWQARGQVVAISRVRPVALVKCYSRDARHRETFAEEMVQELGAEVVAGESAEDAVRDVDIVVTATNAREPVLFGAWLRPGVHINAIGSNWADRRELDTAAVVRSDRIVVDDLEQARIESGDLIAAVQGGRLSWEQAVELGAIAAGDAPARTSEQQITLFASQGIALEDVAAMKLAYDRARALGVGEPLKKTTLHDPGG